MYLNIRSAMVLYALKQTLCRAFPAPANIQVTERRRLHYCGVASKPPCSPVLTISSMPFSIFVQVLAITQAMLSITLYCAILSTQSRTNSAITPPFLRDAQMIFGRIYSSGGCKINSKMRPIVQRLKLLLRVRQIVFSLRTYGTTSPLHMFDLNK